MNTLGMIAIVVDDYDQAISHYVNDLGFALIEDKEMTPEKRWVVVAPSSDGARILLAKAATDAQKAASGTLLVVELVSSCIQPILTKPTTPTNHAVSNLSNLRGRRHMVKLLYSKTSTETSGI